MLPSIIQKKKMLPSITFSTSLSFLFLNSPFFFFLQININIRVIQMKNINIVGFLISISIRLQFKSVLKEKKVQNP